MPDPHIAITERAHRSADFARDVYGATSTTQIQYFLMLNKLQEPDVLPPGTIVVVPSSMFCTREEGQLANDFAELRKNGADRRGVIEDPQLINQFYDVIGVGLAPTTGALGAYTYGIGRQVKGVEGLLKELQGLYRNTYHQTGNLRGETFQRQRANILGRLDNVMKGWVRTAAIGAGEPNIRRGLDLSTKRTLHRWNAAGTDAGIPRLDRATTRLNRVASTARRLGYVGVALDVAWTANDIRVHAQSDAPDRQRKIAGSTGSLAGSVGGGVAGGAVGSYLVCNLIFGFPTGGTSLIWCTVIAGGAGAVGGGMAGSSLGREGGYRIHDTMTR